MKTTAEIIVILSEFKARYADKYGIERLGLFGSVARGEQTEGSDVDICIELKEPDYFVRMEIKEKLEELFHVKVDLVPLTGIMRSLFRRKIEQDAIYIYRRCNRYAPLHRDENGVGYKQDKPHNGLQPISLFAGRYGYIRRYLYALANHRGNHQEYR